MANPCANVLCDVNTVCRVVFKCATCPPTVQCVDPKLIPIGIDDVCRGRGFQGSLLVDGPAPNTNYTSLRCTQDCPPGSTCVKTEACCGVCCRGQSLPPRVKPGTCPTVELIACSQTRCQNDDQCPDNLKCCQSCGNRCSVPISPGATDTCRPPCQLGTSCVSKISDCPPGQPCTQVYKPGCVPVDCLNCTDTCVPKKLTAGYECKPKTGCLKPCPPGQQCQYVTTLCSPGEQTNPTCKEVYECRQVDPCGGCPRGRTCIYTGNRCPDPTCPTFQCVVDNECGGCPDGLRCRQRLACRPPTNCDPKVYSGSNPCGTETCSTIFECVLN
ncbi:WAP four-disulfide core domain protein 3-like [Physella acuta]|uniref:WAP four-disulfide core domain protein 3-like n=1 Tax=Physella acuta TaxID=109671 RepID=UPI0027DBC07B|nr:WAP four-disulfide core domain protein 3-like [Physella acuta]